MTGRRGIDRLPFWARWALAMSPRRHWHADIRADLTELYVDRAGRYGRFHAHRRLARDLVSLWRGTWSGGRMVQDLRFALRLMRKNPAPVALCLAGLSVAIAVATTAFGLVNATMLKPYGVADPASIVSVSELNPEHASRPFPWFSYPKFLRMREGATLARLEASMLEKVRFSGRPSEDGSPSADGGPSRFLLFASGGYLEMLGARPFLGRPLVSADDAPGAAPAAVVSYYVWSTDLAADPDYVGKTVWLNNTPVTLVGVLGREFSAPGSIRPAIWAPFAIAHRITGGTAYTPTSGGYVEVIGRLNPGAARSAAQENLQAVMTALAPPRPDGARPAPPRLATLHSAATPIDGPEAGESYFALACLFLGLGLLVALACANTANLLLAAATSRAREIGVRLALGATRTRLLAQLITESALLGLFAGGVAYLLAYALTPAVAAILRLSPETDLTPDGRVLFFAIAVAVVSGVGAGLTPARFGSRGDVLSALRAEGAIGGRGPRPSRLRMSFVAFQAAVSMLLLAAAALLTRTSLAMTRADVGFDVDRVMTINLGGPRDEINTDAYLQNVIDAVRQVPAVHRVSLSQYLPFGGSIWTDSITHDGRSFEIDKHQSDAELFPAMGLRIVHGRSFTPDEVAALAPVALISENVARAFFGDADPVGQSLSEIPSEEKSGRQPNVIIVGVVAEAVLSHLHSEQFGAIYQPLERTRSNPPGLVVRAASPGLAALQVDLALRRLDARLRPNTSMARDGLDRFLENKRMMAWLAGPLAVLSFVLAVLGVFGVTAFVVHQRSHEVSVRLAIGASAGEIRRLLVVDSLRPVLIGLAIGLLAAIGLSKTFASMLAGISPYDPVALAIAVATLLIGALAAVAGPARRASRADPAAVLRQA